MSRPHHRHPAPNGPEFSRPVAVDSLLFGRSTHELIASAQERGKIAGRLALQSIEELRATVWLNRRRSGESTVVEATGEGIAAYTQTCVVTLEPLSVEIEFELSARFVNSSIEYFDPEIEPFDDHSEPTEGGTIDLAEFVTQSLALEIDPFPRKAGAEFVVSNTGEDTTDTAEKPADDDNPFAMLKKLTDPRRKRGN